MRSYTSVTVNIAILFLIKTYYLNTDFVAIKFIVVGSGDFGLAKRPIISSYSLTFRDLMSATVDVPHR